jgi:outer membrane protein TolC
MPNRTLAFLLLLAFGAHSAAAQAPLTLEEALRLAQTQGAQARAASATRDAALFRDRQFYSRQLPQLTLGGTVPSYNRSIIQVLQPDGSTLFRPQDQTNANLTLSLSQKLPVTGADFFITSSLARLSLSGQQNRRTWSSTPFSVGIRQELFRPNANAWDRREQEHRGTIAERQYLETREDLAIQVTGLFFDAYSARLALANAESNAAINDTLYTLNKGRFEVGKIGENDLLQSELALLRARASLDGARLELDRAKASLRLALGMPVGAPIEVTASAVVPEVLVDTARAVQEALKNRAVVSEVALQQVQAQRGVTTAKLSNGLNATVQASYGYNATGNELGTAYDGLLEARQLSVGVQVPLLQWGVRKEGVRAAQADRDRVVETGELTLAQAAQDAHFAALQVAQARRSLELAAKGDTVAGKRFEVALNRYVIGRIAIDNLYVAQAEKDGALAQFVQSLRGYWQAYYRLRRLTLFDFATGQPLF